MCSVLQCGAVRMYEIGEHNTLRTVIANGGNPAIEHEAIIGELTSGKKYEIEILSGKTWYDDSGKPLQFTL